jgi:DNA recombination-dependent growth factor C
MLAATPSSRTPRRSIRESPRRTYSAAPARRAIACDVVAAPCVATKPDATSRALMGFLSASSTIVRFDARAPVKIDRHALCDAVNKRAFREHDEDGLPKQEAFGWVAIHDPLVLDLAPSDVFFQQYVLLGFRYDRRVAPAKLVRLETRRAEEERKQAQGLERLARAVRREIKEEIAARLLLRALPSPSLFECAWDLERGCVYFTGKSRAPREAFQALFRETTGVAPIPVIPYLAAERVGLAAAVVDRIRGVEPSRFASVEEAPTAVAAAAGAGSGVPW